jgi:hypothetical protein
MLCIYLAVDTFRDERRQEYQALRIPFAGL